MSEITVEGYNELKRELANVETGKAKLEGEREAKASQLQELITTVATALGVDAKLITREFLVEKKEAIEAKVAGMKATLGEV
jgi:hypothetical protein